MAIIGPPRASYASDPRRSRGRLVPEAEAEHRNAFRRDCDRIIHSAAFRRLKHKTQVFVAHESDHYRTRLTHTLEVTQIARSLARALGLDEDLAEALALAHDLGHPPFGHAGERALDRCLEASGGFDHNAQALLVVTRLERRYARFDGLNLTWETLEGLVKHNGPLRNQAGEPAGRYRARGIPDPIATYDRSHPLDLASYAGPEAQCAAIADDIAYNAHDIDDGLRAGLFGLEELAGLPLLRDILDEVRALFPDLADPRRAHELVRALISRTILDVLDESGRRLRQLQPDTADAIRSAAGPVIAFSPAMDQAEQAIKKFLRGRMYRSSPVLDVMGRAEAVVERLFERYASDADAMPLEWRSASARAEDKGRAIADFIAGMTDRYALLEHGRLFDSVPELR